MNWAKEMAKTEGRVCDERDFDLVRMLLSILNKQLMNGQMLNACIMKIRLSDIRI